MRKINYGLMSMLALLMCAITSCGDAERPSYDGPNYILFSDTLTVLAVQNNEEVFDIPVAATEACSYDRTVAVEVIDKKSNAIEGKHYTIESNTITIKAGERAANVRIRGNYDAIAATDSLGLTLRLLTQQADQWDLYEKSYEAKVILQVYTSIQNPRDKELLRQTRHLIIGGGAIDRTLGEELRDFPHAVWSTYGMTETLSHIALRRLNGPEATDWYTPFNDVQISLSPEGTLTIDAPQVCPLSLVTNESGQT
jgi:acyl-CoA synthetase (AMP-forming)/AMP-acid ligase II